MLAQLISLTEASQRLEKNGISGRLFAELLVKSEPLLLGVRPGNELHDPIDLARVTSLQVEPGNVVVADGVRWADVKLVWRELCAAFKKRGRVVPAFYITPELVARSREPARTAPFLGNLRPPVTSARPVSPVPQPARPVVPEWFEDAVFTGHVPASGKPPLAKRGPKSGKRANTAAAIRKDLQDKILTVEALKAMRQKELVGRYGVSRDTASKARNDALQSLVEMSTSTNDK
jgi:hypothetical protein